MTHIKTYLIILTYLNRILNNLQNNINKSHFFIISRINQSGNQKPKSSFQDNHESTPTENAIIFSESANKGKIKVQADIANSSDIVSKHNPLIENKLNYVQNHNDDDVAFESSISQRESVTDSTFLENTGTVEPLILPDVINSKGNYEKSF